MTERLDSTNPERAHPSRRNRLHTFLSDAAMLNMSSEQIDCLEFNDRMNERLQQIEVAQASRKRGPIKLSEIIKGGYVAVGEPSAGVIYRGR